MLPTEPIRGKSFEEYLKAAWMPDEDDGNFMVDLVCAYRGITPEDLKMLPKQLQVYQFEKMRKIMLKALKRK